VLDHRLVKGENLIFVLEMQIESAQLVNDFADDVRHPLYYLIVVVLDDERSKKVWYELLLYRLQLQVL